MKEQLDQYNIGIKVTSVYIVYQNNK